jgi:hypothetical protein
MAAIAVTQCECAYVNRGVFEGGGASSRGARGVCGEHAWASPGGKRWQPFDRPRTGKLPHSIKIPRARRPSGTCDSRFLPSRHSAGLRAGLMTIAPPALGWARTHDPAPDGRYRRHAMRMRVCESCSVWGRGASSRGARAVCGRAGLGKPRRQTVAALRQAQDRQASALRQNPKGMTSLRDLRLPFSPFPALRRASCRANDNRASGARMAANARSGA